MRNKPNLEGLSSLIGSASRAQITDEEYQKRTGAVLPKGKSYLMHNSALARWLYAKGFEIESVEEEPIIRRIVRFRKKEGKE